MKNSAQVNSLIPTCITFGPLFMILWIREENVIHYASFLGVFMLMGGLVWMHNKITRLQKEIDEIKGKKD